MVEKPCVPCIFRRFLHHPTELLTVFLRVLCKLHVLRIMLGSVAGRFHDNSIVAFKELLRDIFQKRIIFRIDIGEQI